MRADGRDEEGASEALLQERKRGADDSGMPADLSAIAKRLRTLDRGEIRHWLERGALLTQAREILGTDAGFRRWLRQQHIAKTTAYKAMAAQRDFGSVPTSGHFSKEAMAILAQSADAKADAVELSSTKRITAKLARDLVARYMPPTPKPIIANGFQQIIPAGDLVIIVKGKNAPTREELVAALLAAARQAPLQAATTEPLSSSWLKRRAS